MDVAEDEIPQLESAIKEALAIKKYLEADLKHKVDRFAAKEVDSEEICVVEVVGGI